jgi:hypothetical protein
MVSDRFACDHANVSAPTGVDDGVCRHCPFRDGDEWPAPQPFVPAPLIPLELGDLVESALTKIGITKDKVEQWLGRPCGCAERQEKLNKLSRWAKRVLGIRRDL